MKKVHLTLQGKGGTGKTFVASLLAQYHQREGLPVICLDTDPVNATFSGYAGCKAERVDLMEGADINPRRFDNMVARLVTEDSHFVIDNGAASFLPLTNYLIENDVVRLLDEAGKEVVIHTVITGSMGLRDTLTGFLKLADHIPEPARIVVWLNEFVGDIIADDGKTFEQMKAYTSHKNRVAAILRIHRRTAATFGRDLEQMLHQRLTFEEVSQNPTFELMAKQRLAIIQRDLFNQLALVS